MSQAALKNLRSEQTPENAPIFLLRHGDHRVYWVGIREETAFRCNVYLIVDGDRVILVNTGNRSFFPVVRDAVTRALGDNASVTDIVLCHQDPDVAASMVDWLELVPPRV